MVFFGIPSGNQNWQWKIREHIYIYGVPIETSIDSGFSSQPCLIQLMGLREKNTGTSHDPHGKIRKVSGVDFPMKSQPIRIHLPAL